MKLTQKQIDQIRLEFQEMKSKWDLFILIQKVDSIQKKASTINYEDLRRLSNSFNSAKMYDSFEIKKKSGGIRKIHSPHKKLSSIQQTLSTILQCVFEPNKSTFGFVKKRSIVDNARVHCGSNYVYNIDLKDFFTSIDQARVWKCLQLIPFNLHSNLKYTPFNITLEELKQTILTTTKESSFKEGNDKIFFKKYKEKGQYFAETVLGPISASGNIDFNKQVYAVFENCSLESKLEFPTKGSIRLVNDVKTTSRIEIANLIANLCCAEMEVERLVDSENVKTIKKNVLPQGAATSPVLTNIVCQRLDFLLSGVAKRFGLKYSRYADDITFSSMHNVYQKDGEFIKELQRIINEQGFRINKNKTRLQKSGYRQEVTGLIVNDKVNVNKRYIKQLRQWIHYLERYDYNTAEKFFMKQYFIDKGHVKGSLFPSLYFVVEGKLNYLKMVKGSSNSTYLTLARRFNKLNLGFTWYNDVVNTWEIKGLESAKELNIPKLYSKKSRIWLNTRLNITDNSTFIANLIEVGSMISLPTSLKKRTLSLIEAELFDLTSYKERLSKNKLFSTLLALFESGKIDIVPIESDKVSSEAQKSIEYIKKTHNPENTVQYLNNFARRDTKFKWFTHKKDGGEFEYNKSVTDVLEDPNVIKNFNINKETWHQIKNFLYDNTAHSWRIDLNHGSKFSWSNEEVKKWCDRNQGKYPDMMPLPEDHKIKELGVSYFGDLIKHYKHTIQFRNDDKSKTFDFKIKNLLYKELDTDFEINFTEHYKKNSRMINVFIDVNSFLTSVKQILEWIKDYKAISHEVTIELRDESNYWEFSIEHEGGYIEKSIQHFLNPNDGDLGKIRKLLFQNADLAIDARFLDGTFRLIVLEKEKSTDKDEKLEYIKSNISSVKYVFKLYKVKLL